MKSGSVITILGIDPGSRLTGYGVIKTDGQSHTYVASGCIRTPTGEMPDRLSVIYHDISEVIQQYRPEEAAIENIFICKNPSSALKLGHARGAALVALASSGLLISEYAPRLVKQAIVGYGAAQKSQVQHMICIMLKLSDVPQADAADALAVALCHAQHRAFSDGKALLLTASKRRRGRRR